MDGHLLFGLFYIACRVDQNAEFQSKAVGFLEYRCHHWVRASDRNKSDNKLLFLRLPMPTIGPTFMG
jgi:hypothetical protein